MACGVIQGHVVDVVIDVRVTIQASFILHLLKKHLVTAAAVVANCEFVRRQ